MGATESTGATGKKYNRVNPIEVPQEANPNEVLASVSNAKLYFIMFMVFDISVVVNSIVQLWSLGSTSDSALFMRHSFFGEHISTTLATCSAIVVGLCFLWDAFLGGVLVHELSAFTKDTATKAHDWSQVSTMADINFFCNFGTLLLWLAARLTVVATNPDWTNIMALGCVFLLRIVKIRPMYTFKTCVRKIVQASDAEKNTIDGGGFDQFNKSFGTPEGGYGCLWKLGCCSVAVLVFVVVFFFILSIWYDHNANSSFGDDGDVDVPPLPVTAATAPQQPLGQQSPFAPAGQPPPVQAPPVQPPPVQQPPVQPPAIQRSLRNLQAAPRQLKMKNWVPTFHNKIVYYCNDYGMRSGDDGCGTHQVGRHLVTNKAKDAFLVSLKSGAASGALCMGAAAAMDLTGYGIPAGMALGAACALGVGGSAGAAKFKSMVRDDECVHQCSDEIPMKAKLHLWCIPHDRPEMLECDHCSWCDMCDIGEKRGFDFSADQCH